jgi:DNA polymerase-3 subunit delta|tara:strand:- start:1980 stop:3005 length:1026 start_codon:yes stop_codon:yes gene_type:complete
VKISPAKVEQFLRSINPELYGVLVFGPDDGLVRERSDSLARLIVPDLNDPFRIGELTTDRIRNEPALLTDEISANALTGGRRIVRIRDASDELTGNLESVIDSWSGDTLIIMQAGNLSPQSTLRKLAEGSDKVAAIPCYTDDALGLERIIRETLNEANISIEPNTVNWLTSRLGVDRAVSRQELEKLSIYAGHEGRIEIYDAISCAGDSSVQSLENLVFAAADGDRVELDRSISQALQDGIPAITVLRTMVGHLNRLHIVTTKMAAGENVERAMKSLRPPVFFKFENRFRNQLVFWRPDRICRAIELILDAEYRCKLTSVPEAALCGRTLLQVSTFSRQNR